MKSILKICFEKYKLGKKVYPNVKGEGKPGWWMAPLNDDVLAEERHFWIVRSNGVDADNVAFLEVYRTERGAKIRNATLRLLSIHVAEVKVDIRKEYHFYSNVRSVLSKNECTVSQLDILYRIIHQFHMALISFTLSEFHVPKAKRE